MKKNKEWLKSEVTMRISGDREKGPLIYVDIGLQQALELIDQLDEPEQKEKIQVPLWLAKLHTANLGKGLYAHLSDLDTYYSDEMSENQNLLAHMVLGDEWEVKVEVKE